MFHSWLCSHYVHYDMKFLRSSSVFDNMSRWKYLQVCTLVADQVRIPYISIWFSRGQLGRGKLWIIWRRRIDGQNPVPGIGKIWTTNFGLGFNQAFGFRELTSKSRGNPQFPTEILMIPRNPFGSHWSLFWGGNYVGGENTSHKSSSRRGENYMGGENHIDVYGSALK